MAPGLWFVVALPSALCSVQKEGASGFHLFPSLPFTSLCRFPCGNPRFPGVSCWDVRPSPPLVEHPLLLPHWGLLSGGSTKGTTPGCLLGSVQDPAADSLGSMLSNPLAAFPCSQELVLRNVFLLAQQCPSEASVPAASRRAWQPWASENTVSHWVRGWGSLPVLLLKVAAGFSLLSAGRCGIPGHEQPAQVQQHHPGEPAGEQLTQVQLQPRMCVHLSCGWHWGTPHPCVQPPSSWGEQKPFQNTLSSVMHIRS